MGKIILAYVPVLHEGYYQLLSSHKDAKTAYVFDRTLLKEFDWLRKDLRTLDPELVVSAIRSWKLLPQVSLLSVGQLDNLASEDHEIIMPDEDVSHDLAERYFKHHKITFEPIFLRWDRRRSEAKDEVNPDHRISEEVFDKQMMQLANEESRRSGDLWRRVGALIIKDGHVWSVATNHSQPTDFTSWIEGDPRNNLNKGVGIEMSLFQHAEATLIAQAAKQGISLEGADMYVTAFPCPPCAMLIANSGIKRCFYAGGYGVLNGERDLKANNVELIKVDAELPLDRAEVYRPYPEKT